MIGLKITADERGRLAPAASRPEAEKIRSGCNPAARKP